MRLAPHAPGAPHGATIDRHSRAVPLVPAALLVLGMFGFAWVQIAADAQRPSPAAMAATPATPSAREAAAPAVEKAAPAAPAPAARQDAATERDAVPSLEDQELASYSTCGA